MVKINNQMNPKKLQITNKIAPQVMLCLRNEHWWIEAKKGSVCSVCGATSKSSDLWYYFEDPNDMHGPQDINDIGFCYQDDQF